MPARAGWRSAAAVVLALFMSAGALADDAEDALWRGLATGETAALMRHATAPGVGDPDDFDVDACATQRNLSDAGRAEARAVGWRMREHGIREASVRSSQWCRCLDTARLLGIGAVVPTPALNSFFADRERGAAQTEAIRALLSVPGNGRPRVLVTHQVNITALTDVFPDSGEIVVVRSDADGLSVVGRIAPP